MRTESLIDFQISLERRISRIYRKISKHFLSESEVGQDWIDFWGQLALDEARHASILGLEKKFLHSGSHIKTPVHIDPKIKEGMDVLLTECEERIAAGITQKEAIQMLVTLENSEDKKTFSSLLKATDSKVLGYFADYSKSIIDHEQHVLALVKRYGSE